MLKCINICMHRGVKHTKILFNIKLMLVACYGENYKSFTSKEFECLLAC